MRYFKYHESEVAWLIHDTIYYSVKSNVNLSKLYLYIMLILTHKETKNQTIGLHSEKPDK